MLGLRFCARAFSSCGKRGHSSSRCTGLSLSRPLLLWSTGSRGTGSEVVAHGPSCSAACGIFSDQDSNPCPLHWQADSQPLRHQGSPVIHLFVILFLKLFFSFFIDIILYVFALTPKDCCKLKRVWWNSHAVYEEALPVARPPQLTRLKLFHISQGHTRVNQNQLSYSLASFLVMRSFGSSY